MFQKSFYSFNICVGVWINEGTSLALSEQLSQQIGSKQFTITPLVTL